MTRLDVVWWVPKDGLFEGVVFDLRILGKNLGMSGVEHSRMVCPKVSG